MFKKIMKLYFIFTLTCVAHRKNYIQMNETKKNTTFIISEINRLQTTTRIILQKKKEEIIVMYKLTK